MKLTNDGLKKIARFGAANASIGITARELLDGVRDAVNSAMYDRKWSLNDYPDTAIELVPRYWGVEVVGFALDEGDPCERHFWDDYARNARKITLSADGCDIMTLSDEYPDDDDEE